MTIDTSRLDASLAEFRAELAKSPATRARAIELHELLDATDLDILATALGLGLATMARQAAGIHNGDE